MTLLLLLLSPLAVLALSLRGTQPRLLARSASSLGWLHVGLTALVALPVLWSSAPAVPAHGFCIDAVAAWFLLLTALVVASALTHAIGFFEREADEAHAPTDRDIRQFYGFVALFLLAMELACCADDLGLLWISVEATTLMSAPLVYYHRSQTALEATWKYVIICSVGIAFAFFGTAIFFTASAQAADLPLGSLSLVQLTAHASALPVGLLRLGFVFTLLGYGTKAGLFPLHTWLPDAHSEAPAPASAMLSGALLNCALIGLWRVGGLMAAAGQDHFVRLTLLPLALATVVAAGLMLLSQHDLKRLLAYSSMENMGLMATAIALGNGAGFALLALNHSLAKVALFLLAGNAMQDYGSKSLDVIRGLQRRRPLEALLLLLGVLAVAGTPPFGSFLAEWQILGHAADGSHAAVVVLLCLGLAVAFIALTIHVGGLLWGEPPADLPEPRPEPGRLTIPAVLIGLALVLGVALTPELLALAQGVSR